MEREENGISKFPEATLHHILSFLTPREADKTRLLSKAWLSAWQTRPILCFYEPYHLERLHPEHNRKMFFNFVNKVLLGYREHNNAISTLELWMDFRNDSADQLANQWIKIAVEKGLKKLNLKTYTSYRLPSIIFEAKFLQELVLYGCNFEQQVIIDGNLMCQNLRRLDLEHVHLSDEIFQEIISTCPSIEDLKIVECKSLRNIKVNNLRKLKIFSITYHDQQIVELVDAPNLEFFRCRVNSNFFKWIPDMLKLSASLNVKQLVLHGIGITDMFFVNFTTIFPNIEALTVQHCNDICRIKLCSQSLRTIQLILNKKFEHVHVDAPKIDGFYYTGDTIPRVRVTTASSHWESRIELNLNDGIDNSCFLKLKETLTNLRQAKIFLGLSSSGLETFDDIDETRDGSNFRPEIEELSVKLRFFVSTSFSALLDRCLWSFRPKIIHHEWHFPGGINFTVLLPKLLMIRRNEDDLNLQEIKFWPKEVKEVEVVILKRADFDGWQPELLEWRVLLNSGVDDRRAVRFSLEWW